MVDAVVVAIVATVVIVLGLRSSSRPPSALAPGTSAITVGAAAGTRPIPAGFLGLSLEYSAIEAYAGNDPLAINPVFEQLVRNLTPGQGPVLRIGGDSADHTWWPLPGATAPPGVNYSLGQRWLQVTQAVAAALGARLILGLNLEADDPSLARFEAQELIGGLGTPTVQALELGNEPELYGGFPWYRTADGRGVRGRPSSYGYAAFVHDFSTFAATLPPVSLAGPTLGGPALFRDLAQFLASEPQVGLVTLHRYPLQLCFVKRDSPRYPTIAHLLSAAASAGLANLFAASTATAHGRGLPLRVDELNTVSCGADPGISQTFASALWAIDALFELARVGVDGVNVHTYPGAGYELFHFTDASAGWRGSVTPEYYGLMLFAQAAPAGSRLLSISGAGTGGLKIWATSAPDRRIRIVLINQDSGRGRPLALRVPAAAGTATLERLVAPSLRAASGVTLAGQSFGPQTATGLLAGRSSAVVVRPDGGRYLIRVPAASAAMLVLASR